MKRIQWLAMMLAAGAMLTLASCGGGETNRGSGGGDAPADGGVESGGGDAPGDGEVDSNGGDEDGEDNGQDANGEETADYVAARDAMVTEAWEFLQTTYNQQGRSPEEMGWGPESANAPFTGLVLQGLFGSNVWDPADEKISASVDWLLDAQESSGAWSFMPGNPGMRGTNAVYTTSIMAQLLVDLNGSDGPWKGKLDNQIASARDYLKQSQVGNPDGPAPEYGKDQVGFGGWAYSKEEIEENVGEKGKPASNMSTTSFAIDALRACGVSEDDPLWEDALTFLKRNQNAGEVQDEGFEAMARVEDDEGNTSERRLKPASEGNPDHGGAIYSEETSKASGYTDNEDGSVTLFSYGSMTYNLLRAYLFAGLDKDSTPVKLAWRWIQRNYTVERVPGFRIEEEYDMGLYYYYMSMARTLDALDVDVVDEPDRGLEHNWRADIVRALGERQKDDGHWINENHSRWMENSPVLCTAYVLNALRHTRE